MHDRFSQEMPWEEEKVIDTKDWQGESLVVGCTYYNVGGEYVHEDEITEYITDNFMTVEVDVDSRL